MISALNLEWERHAIHVCDIMRNFVNVIWTAVHGRRVHWLVESRWSVLFQRISAFLPNAWVRADDVVSMTERVLERAVEDGEIAPVDTVAVAHVLGGLGS